MLKNLIEAIWSWTADEIHTAMANSWILYTVEFAKSSVLENFINFGCAWYNCYRESCCFPHDFHLVSNKEGKKNPIDLHWSRDLSHIPRLGYHRDLRVSASALGQYAAT